MSMPKLRNLLLALGVYMLLMLISPLLNHEKYEQTVLETPKASVENEREDLQSRWDYEQQMLADPGTGEIPSNYRQQEFEFSQQMRLAEENVPQIQSTGAAEAVADLDWFSLGPNNFGGRTRAFALDVRNENTLLAGGVSGGMWKSTDDGINWQKATTPEQIHSVSSIAQDIRAGNEDVWYYGTGELVGNSTRAPGAPFRGDGIFKSVDGGDSWTHLSSTAAPSFATFGSPLQYVWDIETDPSSTDDVVIAAIWSGIVRSDDGGESWTTVLGRDFLNLPDGSNLNELESIFYTDVHRTADNTFYASLSSTTNSENLANEAGVYRSDDGINWTRILILNNTVNRRTEIASSPSDPNIVFFFTDENGGYRLRRYDRGINQVTDLSNNLPDGSDDIEAINTQDSYNMVVKVHPTNPQIVFIGGTNLYRSTDGFSTSNNTAWIGGYDPEQNDGSLYQGHHPDQHEMVFIPSFPDAAFSINDGGIFISQNILAENVEYRNRNNNYATTQFYTGTFSQYPPDNFVLGGTQDNGTLLTDNINRQGVPNGVRVIGGDGAYTASTRFGVYYYMSFQNSRIYRLSLNQNAEITSFTRVDPVGGGGNPGQPYLFINPYVLDANNGNRMYLAGGDAIWRNRNLSQIPAGSNSPATTNWSRLSRTRTSSGILSALQTSTVPRDILYYGSSVGNLYKMTEANSEDYVVQDITGSNFPENGYIRSLAIDPTNADRVLVSFSNYGIPSLFFTEDGGNSYVDVSGNLEENPDGSGAGPSVRWVTIVPKQGGSFEYLVGTSIGLFSTEQLNGSSTSWSRASHEEIGNVVVNMIDYRRNDGKIVASTHGNGMFTSQIPDVLPRDDDGSDAGFVFNNAYPNPFQDFTTLQFSVPETDFTILRVYDSSGRLVYLSTGSLAFPGENEFFWEGTNTLDQPVPNGVYLIRLTYRGVSRTKKVLLNR